MGEGSFSTLIRAWRDRLSPEDVGITSSGTRRVPGLRREELAAIAAISVDYLLRLEQGRATHPSAQVVSALARALHLTRDERDLLYRSAGLLPPQDGTVTTHIPPGVRRLTSRLHEIPLAVFSADWSMVAWNDMWSSLVGDPIALAPSERNLARAIFGSGPAATTRYPSHSERGTEVLASAIVGDLRHAVERYPHDTGLGELILQLQEESPWFVELWEVAIPREHDADRKTIEHPEVGSITLDCDVLTVPGSDLRIVAYTAPTDTEDASKLSLLRVTRGVTTLPVA